MENVNSLNVDDFFDNDFINYASYDNIRKIASCIDGLKNSSRKVVCTVLDKNLKSNLKVQQLASLASEYTDYLHGSLDGVIVSLGQNFTGSNNYPLIEKKGNFGTRSIPIASAARYIYAKASDFLGQIIDKNDCNILVEQYFEGKKIEPRFYLPSLPLILVNGSTGISTGFSQTILPRNIQEIALYLKDKLTSKNSSYELKPFYQNFKGTFEKDVETNRWICHGVAERVKNDLIITEIPINISIDKFFENLDTLKDNGTIKSYQDLSDGDDYHIIVKLYRDSKVDFKDFKLIGYITENLTCIDEDNKIKVFSSVQEIIDHYYSVKITYLEKRKTEILKKIKEEIQHALNVIKFCEFIIKSDIKKLTKKDLQDFVASINAGNDLLRIPVTNLTADEVIRQKENLVKLKNLYLKTQETTLEEMWLEDLQKINVCKI